MSDDIENEGAIDTGDDTTAAQTDNSGAAPVQAAPEDNSGQPAIPPAAIDTGSGDQPQEQPRTGPNGPIASGVKRIVSYLMGADAAHPQVLDQAGAQVDPHGTMSPSDRNLLAIEDARKKGGDNAAWAMLQANRVAYNAQTAFARTAIEGTQQKPADIHAAVDAANKAQANVLDGSNIQFAAGTDGITATVTAHGGQQPETLKLSPQQFAQFLDVGGDGQWDKIMAHSAPETLKRLAASSQPGQAAPQQGAPAAPQRQAPARRPSTMSNITGVPDNGPPAGRMPTAAPQQPAPKTNFGSTPSTLNLSGNDNQSPPAADKTNYGDELEARAMRMFPSVNEEPQRNHWMAQQEESELNRANKIDVAGETGKQRIKVAEATGRSRENVANTTAAGKLQGWKYASDAKTASAQIAADQRAAHAGDQQAGQRVESARKAIASKRATGATITPDEEAFEKQLVQRASQPQQQAPRQQAAQPSGQDQQALQWAKANPRDPRAAKIMQRLGVQ